MQNNLFMLVLIYFYLAYFVHILDEAFKKKLT